MGVNGTSKQGAASPKGQRKLMLTTHKLPMSVIVMADRQPVSGQNFHLTAVF
jgi:hypothetical protein